MSVETNAAVSVSDTNEVKTLIKHHKKQTVMLSQNFLLSLTAMYDETREYGSVWVTIKRSTYSCIVFCYYFLKYYMIFSLTSTQYYLQFRIRHSKSCTISMQCKSERRQSPEAYLPWFHLNKLLYSATNCPTLSRGNAPALRFSNEQFVGVICVCNN